MHVYKLEVSGCANHYKHWIKLLSVKENLMGHFFGQWTLSKCLAFTILSSHKA